MPDKQVIVYPDDVVKYVVKTPRRRNTITYKEDYSIPEEILEQICAEGLDALPDLVRIMINTAPCSVAFPQ